MTPREALEKLRVRSEEFRGHGLTSMLTVTEYLALLNVAETAQAAPPGYHFHSLPLPVREALNKLAEAVDE